MSEHVLNEAIAFAVRAHDGMTRKASGQPYILHPMETAVIVGTMTNDPEVLAAAVLHDVIEDCGVTDDVLVSRFGKRVARLVRAESEDKEPDAQASWQKRKLRTVNRMLAANREEMILTLADKLSNLRAIDRDLRAQGPAFWQRFNQTNPSMHKWYYSSIGEALRPLQEFDAYQEYLSLLDKVFGSPERK